MKKTLLLTAALIMGVVAMAQEINTHTLTTIDLTSSARVCKVGKTINLTAVAKDQDNNEMEGQTITYSVTPEDAGTVENGVYTAAKYGSATITAASGEISNNVTVFNYVGNNVALNKTVIGTGYNEASRVNDGSDATEYQVDPNNGNGGQDVTCSFVIDLGAQYDLTLIEIHFEGACSDAYTIETSVDNEEFDEVYSFSGTNGINNHTDYIYGNNLSVKSAVRYVRFQSTKNSTIWGMKISEFKVYGLGEEEESGLPEGTVKLEQGDNSILLTTLTDGKGNYQLVVKGSNLNGFGGSFWRVSGENSDIRTSITSSTSTQIVVNVKSTSEPQLYTPLYVMMPGEVNFGEITIVWTTVESLEGVSNEEESEGGEEGEGGEEETPRESQPTGDIKHFAPEDATVRGTYEITADADGNVTFTVTGTDLKFVQIQIADKGNYNLTIAEDKASATFTLSGVELNTALYFRFLIQAGEMLGNEMTSDGPVPSVTDPKTFYYIYEGATETEGTATGFEPVKVLDGRANVYDITGRVVRVNVEAKSALSGLSRGIYVVETSEMTKKIVVR